MGTLLESSSMLFLGASGQTGGPFLTVFRKAYPSIPITVFLRANTLDDALEGLGNTTVVHGTFADLSTISDLATIHPIIINCASSMDTALTTTLLDAARTRKTRTGRNSILFHLSGAGNFVDGSRTGAYIPQPQPFNDSNPDHVCRISSANLPNGPCDELILNSAVAGNVNALFVCPGGIYGASKRHVALKAGDTKAAVTYANVPGVWVKWMLDNIEDLGYSPYIGDGSSVFRVVHVDDVVDLMMLVFRKALDTWETYQPEDVYKYFYLSVNEEELRNRDIAEAFAEVARKMGKGTRFMAKSVHYDEAGTVARYLGGNMILQPDNPKKLGWEAKGPGLIETLKLIK